MNFNLAQSIVINNSCNSVYTVSHLYVEKKPLFRIKQEIFEEISNNKIHLKDRGVMTLCTNAMHLEELKKDLIEILTRCVTSNLQV